MGDRVWHEHKTSGPWTGPVAELDGGLLLFYLIGLAHCGGCGATRVLLQPYTPLSLSHSWHVRVPLVTIPTAMISTDARILAAYRHEQAKRGNKVYGVPAVSHRCTAECTFGWVRGWKDVFVCKKSLHVHRHGPDCTREQPDGEGRVCVFTGHVLKELNLTQGIKRDRKDGTGKTNDHWVTPVIHRAKRARTQALSDVDTIRRHINSHITAILGGETRVELYTTAQQVATDTRVTAMRRSVSKHGAFVMDEWYQIRENEPSAKITPPCDIAAQSTLIRKYADEIYAYYCRVSDRLGGIKALREIVLFTVAMVMYLVSLVCVCALCARVCVLTNLAAVNSPRGTLSRRSNTASLVL